MGIQPGYLVEVEVGGMDRIGCGGEGRKEMARQTQAAEQVAEFRAVGPIPGDNGVETTQVVEQAGRGLRDAQEIEASGGNGTNPIGKSHQGNDG